IADCTLVLATTARAHDQAKPVIGPQAAAELMVPHVAAGENVAVLFGRERYGLENHEVALADRIVTFPVHPGLASLNLAQAVALSEGRKGPARGGVLDSAQARALRALLAEYAEARAPGERGPVRGLARLLRRNPTDAERTLWDALNRDRRFAGKGIKRQIPVG